MEEMSMMFDDGDDNDADEDANVLSSSDHIKFQNRPNACGVLSFHNGTEESMFIYVKNYAERGNIQSILNAIDRFCYSRHWMMHVGERKKEFLINAIKSVQTQGHSECCLEIGSYCGYSSLCIANELSYTGHLFCIERDSNCCKWTLQLLDYAMISHKVTVIESDVSSESLSYLVDKMNERQCTSLDLVFIDHEKSLYLADLQQIIAKNLLHSGSTVVADNVLSFDCPLSDYLSYVQDTSGLFSSSVTHRDCVEYSYVDGLPSDSLQKDVLDGVEVSVFK